MNIKDSASFLDEFESEAKAHIETIESAFLDLDALNSSPALLDGVFRAAHSLKGTAGFFSLDKVVSVAHELESVFTRIKNGDLRLTDEIADVALQSVDILKELADNLRSLDTVDIDDILKLLARYSESEKTAEITWGTRMTFDLSNAETLKALKSALKRGHKIYYLGIDLKKNLGKYAKHPLGLLEEILSVGAIIRISLDGTEMDVPAPSDVAAIMSGGMARRDVSTLELLVSSILEPELFLIAVELDSRLIHPLTKEAILGGGSVKRPPKSGAAPSAYAAKGDFSVRLDIAFVNGFMDLANEMILARNQLLSLTSGHTRSIAGLAPVLQNVSRLTSEIQETAMLARMQPIGVVFNKFPRMLRDMAKSLHKDIHLEILGSDVALDKYMLDSLSDPITQLVKNSADHGIESAERRAALGKPPKGKITLNAYMRDGFAVIEVSDDGGGIDTGYVKAKAMERGMHSEDELAAMSENELYALIFEPGFSTSEQVTSVSGRGVGMDIVKTNIEKLGGSIEIESATDRGTTTRLKTPLSLSVVRTLIIKIQGVQYAVPEANVERIVRISTKSKRQFAWVNGSPILNIDGWIIPLITLRGDAPDGALPEYVNADAAKCLILKSGARYYALLIDDALETEETLIKPLPIYLQDCRCYSGVTVLGSGSAIMVLDAEGLMRSAKLSGVEMPLEEDEQPEEETRQVVVFKCSGAEYFAVDASGVSRIKRLAPDHIQEIGDCEYANIAGQTVQLIRPEQYAPVQQRPYSKSWLYLLLLESGDTPAGFLCARVLDKAQTAFALEQDYVESDYVLGTSAYGEKVLIHLDSPGILRSARARRQASRVFSETEGRCASSKA